MYPLDGAHLLFMTGKITLTHVVRATSLKNASEFVDEYVGARSMDDSGKEPGYSSI